MKVALDASALVRNRTGIGNYVYELLVRMVKFHPDWHFCLFSNQDIFFPEFSNISVLVSRPGFKGPAWMSGQLIPEIFRYNPDVFWGGNGYLPAILPRKTKSLLTIHDLVYRQAGDTLPWFSRLSRQIFQPLAVRQADYVFAVSEATNLEMEQFYKRKADDILNPILRADYAPAPQEEILRVRESFSLPSSYFLVLGTLEPRKNLGSLIRAYLSVRKQGLELPMLAIAGGKGWLNGELPELVRQGESLGYVKKLGYVADADMRGLYSGATLFIMPSIYEGFGMPVVEAQLCGVPVAISAIPSLEEASGNVALKFKPSEEGLETFLRDYALGHVSPKVRAVDSIINDPDRSARKMCDVIRELGDRC